MAAVLIFLLMLFACAVPCYCYLRKHHGSLAINSRRQRHTASTRKNAYNTNYASITGPQGVTDTPQSNNNQQLQAETDSPLYEMIPGEMATTNSEHAIPDDQQYRNLATESENLPYLNNQEGITLSDLNTHGQVYDTVTSDHASSSDKPTEAIYSSLNHNLPPSQRSRISSARESRGAGIRAKPNKPQNRSIGREANRQVDLTLDGEVGSGPTYSTLDCALTTQPSQQRPVNTQGAHVSIENGTAKEMDTDGPVYSVVNKALKKKNRRRLSSSLTESQIVAEDPAKLDNERL